MSRGLPWDSLKCELRAFAGLLSLFKADQLVVSRSLQLGCFQKEDGRLRHARHMSLSSRVMVVFWNALASAVRPAVSVPGSTLSNNWGSPTLEDEFFETEFEEVPDFPEICAEMLSADVWRLVHHSRFVRDEDILRLEARSALRAVQCACERYWNVRTLFLLDTLALGFAVDQGKNVVFSFSCSHLSHMWNRTPANCHLVLRSIRVISRSAPCNIQLFCLCITLPSHNCKSREFCNRRATCFSCATNLCVIYQTPV